MTKDIGNYIIHSDGRIFSKKRNRWLKPTLVKGYHYVDLDKKTLVVHRIIANAFIPNPENKPQVNHKNGVRTDNRLENLEWCTSKENVHHAINSGLLVMHKGEMCNASKLTQYEVDKIRSLYVPRIVTQRKLAKQFNVSRANIGYILSNKIW